MSLVDKYDNLGFLSSVPDDKKEDLADIFENLAIHLREEKRYVEDFSKMEVIMFPLMKGLYLKYQETDYKKIYKEFTEFYLTEPEMTNLEIMLFFIEVYKNNLENKK